MRNCHRSSLTAEAAVASRAFGATLRDPRLRCPDNLAIRFVNGFFRFVLLPGPRVWFVRECERRAPGAFFLHQARTKHIDALLATELASGALEQLVILGAGFDSRAYRFADRLRGVRVFEVDHPATSAEKQRRVRRVFGALPSHVTYLAVDFDKETVGGRLAEAGYDSSRVTFFIWEGVTYYIDADAVNATLAMVAAAAKGTAIVFDYLHRSAFQSVDPVVLKNLAAVVRVGEPYRFGVEPEDLGPFVAHHGLVLKENLSPEVLATRYLIGSDGKQWGQLMPVQSLAFVRNEGARPAHTS